MPDAYILGIESSCDETAAAVVRSGEKIVSNVVFSQIATHMPYGGVVPELASREHLRAIVPVVRKALADAGQTYPSLDAIAVTQGPGLTGALLVGLSYAKALAFALEKPLMEGKHPDRNDHSKNDRRKKDGKSKDGRGGFDFSYSGIKTAVLRYVEIHNLAPVIEKRRRALSGIEKPRFEDYLAVCEPETRNLVASFQRAMVDDLVAKTLAAAEANEV